MKRRIWTQDELIIVFNLYLKLLFGKIHSRTVEVIEIASLVNRTTSAIAMRLVNFASVDPFHKNRGVKGLQGEKKQCKPIFDKYIDDSEQLMYESEKILAKFEGLSIEDKYKEDLFDINQFDGYTKERVVQTRVNQNLFRRIVLSNYNSKCAISRIDIPTLLVASHIKPWSEDESNRLNPSNGICLNNLYDRAFDRGLIGNGISQLETGGSFLANL
ncbi:MAG: restriction endonuclease [Bacteroidetes bacterium 4572_112]|nr:MAG: restriction endonuclease [Bacteroidetes bacterium 4572_112]